MKRRLDKQENGEDAADEPLRFEKSHMRLIYETGKHLHSLEKFVSVTCTEPGWNVLSGIQLRKN